MASPDLTIVAADIMHRDVLIHFSNGSSVLFRGPYLYTVRNEDGNVPIPKAAVERDELLSLPLRI